MPTYTKRPIFQGLQTLSPALLGTLAPHAAACGQGMSSAVAMLAARRLDRHDPARAALVALALSERGAPS